MNKDKTKEKMKSLTKIGITVGALVSIVISYHLFWLMHERANPHLLAIQKMLEEEHIQDFKIDINYSDKDIIREISVSEPEATYKKENVFSEVDKIQKIICSYVVEHASAFEFGYKQDSQGELYSEFAIVFLNEDVVDGHPNRTIFYFNQWGKKLETGCNGMNRLIINSFIDENIKYEISKIQFFSEVEEFSCYNMVIDDVNVVNHIKQAKRIELNGVSGDVKTFKKKAEEKGIEVEGE